MWTFVSNIVSLLFNMLFRFFIAFLPRSKHPFISWLQSAPAVILEPKKIVCHHFHFSPIYFPWSDGARCHDPSFLMLSFKPALSLSSFTFMNGSRSSVLLSTHFTKDFLLVIRNSSYHEEISCFSKYEEMQGLESWNQFLKVSSYLKTCPTRFPGARSASPRPELPQGVLKVNSCSSTGLATPQSQMAHALLQSLAMLLASASLWKCKC